MPDLSAIDAAELVRRYLGLVEQRQLEAARRLLAPEFTMHFPGAPAMERLEQLVEWARGRYREIGKDYGRFDTCPGEGHTIVYCLGTLHGTWNDGTAFSGIRFIDRFEVAGGLIRRQDVWNDLAEFRAATP